MPNSEITLNLADVTLRATVTGTGPTVLLLHAGAERRGVWAPVAARMAEHGLRTVAFDLRGHGDSSGQATTLGPITDDVVEMIAREPAPIVVVGASLGGFAALAALAEPTVAHHVSGLILVDVVPTLDPNRVRSWLGANGLSARYAELIEDILGSIPELRTAAAGLTMPILLVRGGWRSPLTNADADRLRATNPRVTVTSVPEAGHLVARDAPTELAHIVSAHANAWFNATDVPLHGESRQGRGTSGAPCDHR